MIRNDLERREAVNQVEYLRTELDKVPDHQQDDELLGGLEAGLRMQMSDIEKELNEYDRLKDGCVTILEAASLDELGELIIKARIAQNWSQAKLAEDLGMEQQQIQRYERNDWQKASLWRIQEVVDALNLDICIRASILSRERCGPGVLWSTMMPDSRRSTTTTYDESAVTVSGKKDCPKEDSHTVGPRRADGMVLAG